MRSREPDGLDYATLFETGIGLAQTLGSDLWTDYNQHDPGVTILQQLCYALTDLAYRTGYDDADLFAPQQSKMAQTTFFLGPDILTCAPVTQHDYRSLFYAQIDNVENSWLRGADDPRNIRGLCDIDVQPYDAMTDNLGDAALEREVRSTYVTTRPLCEDVAKIKILKPFAVAIAADIDIDDSEPANDIAANIVFDLQENLIPAPSYASIQTRRDAGLSYCEIFEGPALDILVDNNTPDKRPMRLSVERFLKIARAAAGVTQIRKLSVAAEGQGAASSGLAWGKDYFPTIDVPGTLAQDAEGRSNFVLERGNVRQTLDVQRILSNIEHQKYMDHEGVLSTMRSIRADAYNAPPLGVSRLPEVYTSIRGQFPLIYGLGPYGVPNLFIDPAGQLVDRGKRRTDHVSQLKAYLLIFEQVMANHLKQLASLPELFSLNADASKETYFSQPLQGLDVEGPLSIRDVLSVEAESAAAQLVEKQDRAIDRRERLLNHLLARFNETFDDKRWTRVWEVNCQTAADIDNMIVRRNQAKTDFLANYLFLGGFRGAGIDYSKPAGGPQSELGDGLMLPEGPESENTPRSKRTCPATGLEERVKLLTGVTELIVIEHILLRDRTDPQDQALADFYSLRLTVVAPRAAIEQQPALRPFVERAVVDNCPAHIASRCLFLDEPSMEDFRGFYADWRNAFAVAFALTGEASEAALAYLDRQSLQLRTFLIDGAHRKSDPVAASDSPRASAGA